jgi:hypothetical protein
VGRFGDRRLYDPGVVGGVVAALWSYWYRDVDAPIPLLAAVLLAPYYAFIGFWWARKARLETAALVGAVTALVGFELVVLVTAMQAVATDAAPKSVLWLLAGLMFAPTVTLVGAFCGFVGGALAHPNAIIQNMGRWPGSGRSNPERLAD